MADRWICRKCGLLTWFSVNGGGTACRMCAAHGELHRDYYAPQTYCDDFVLPEYDVDCWDEDGWFREEYLDDLRAQVSLGSIFTDDYRNRWGIDPARVQDRFDEYDEWLEAEGLEDSSGNLHAWWLECQDIGFLNTGDLIKNPNQ